jgi:hypothetical protein
MGKLFPEKYKDLYDFVENSPPEEFAKAQKRVAEKNPDWGGWMILERIKLKGYHRV